MWLASDIWFAGVTGESAQFSYDSNMKIADIVTRLNVKDVTKLSEGRKILT